VGITKKFVNKGKKLLFNENGNVAMMFGLSAMVLTFMIGMGVDLNRVHLDKSRAQDALDAAVISFARMNANNELPESNADQKLVFLDIYKSNFGEISTSPKDFHLVIANTKVTSTLSQSTPTSLLAALGYDSLDYKISSSAAYEVVDLEMALVVDTTGSIQNNGHVSTVTTALRSLVSSMEPHSPDIALVPFAATVNLGDNWNASWIDFDGDASFHGITFDESTAPVVHHSLFSSMNIPWGNCVEMRPYPMDVQDTPPSNIDPDSQWVPYIGAAASPFTNYLTSGYEYVQTNPTNGMMSQATRDSSQYTAANVANINDPNGVGNYSPNKGCNLNPLMPLSKNFSGMDTAISNLVFQDGTNIPAGLSWGWRVLSPETPFTTGKSYDHPNTHKFIVLFTDGFNDVDGNEPSAYGMHYDGRLVADTYPWNPDVTAVADNRMSELCTNIKDTGITVYVVSFDMPSTSGSGAFLDRLEACATSSEHFFDADNSAELNSAFEKIVKTASRLRIVD